MRFSNPFKRIHSQSLAIRLSLPGAASVSWTGQFRNADKQAAWELYVEMVTTIVTQPLHEGGDEQSALNSLYSLFPTTREVLRRHGPQSSECGRAAIAILNRAVRPTTTKWHGKSLSGAFAQESQKAEFRRDLEELQRHLFNYVEQLAKIAGIPNSDFQKSQNENERNAANSQA